MIFNRKALKNLNSWKKKLEHKPLVIRGARQVGKTSLIKYFGENQYDHFININLERFDQKELFKNVKTVEEFEGAVEIFFKSRVTKNHLIFIDEIQNTPNLIPLLRFFYEDKVDYDVVAAGSLLEAVLEESEISMPVGRVEYLYLYPLDFFEYLEAVNETELLNKLKSISSNEAINGEGIPEYLDHLAIKKFNEFLLVGGMPEAVAEYAKNHRFSELQSVYSSLFQTYTDDVYKYAKENVAEFVKHVIKHAPQFAGQTFYYNAFGGSEYGSRDMIKAFSILENIMILNQVIGTGSRVLPITPSFKRAKKLLFLDVGLVNYQANNVSEILKDNSIYNRFKGRIAEQIVGQHIISQRLNQLTDLYYWAKKKEKGEAEVDFCLGYNGQMIGIEAKSGTSGKLRSLFSFSDALEKAGQEHKLVRVHTGHFKLEKLGFSGKTYEVYSIPIYLLPRLFDILDEIT